ncbi:MAG: isochorismate synthase MenF [Rhodothermales bacterium]
MIDSDYIIAPETVSDPARVRRLLAGQVRRLLTGPNGHPASEKHIIRLVLRLDRVDPFRWLQAQDAPARLYWSGREGSVETAAVGQADVCMSPAPAGFEAMRRHLAPVLASCDARVRYYGGVRFDPVQPAEAAWSAFGAYRFILPRFELRCHDDGATLICNLVLPNDTTRRDAILAWIDRLALPALGLAGDVPMPIFRKDRPDAEGWRRTIEWALAAFTNTPLDKVVFAREASFGFSEDLDPVALLENLKAGTPDCFHFFFQPEEGVAFVGASPERLFRRQGRLIDSEAVAGTRPRGASASDDARLLEELLRSDKDRREHEYVRISMREELAPLAEEFYLDAEPSEMKLASGRHLVSRVRATLRDGVTSLDVLKALHPTPAVGGYPTTDAIAAIRAQEPFDRGWYAGPVGWIGPGAAEFAVGIRSGLVQPRTLSLYSGAGIVTGSTPEGEWDEIEHKIIDFIKVLGLDLQRTHAA